MNVYEQRLSQIIKILKAFQPQKIYAYGSWVTGKPRADSDLDVAVIVDSKTDTLGLKRQLLTGLWETHYPYDIEPDVHIIPRDVFERRLEHGDPFMASVSQGKVIYEA